MTTSWDDSYTGAELAPWDIGRPQPAFARLAGDGLLSGLVLDVGCGTGENTLLAASHGATATGMDIAPTAIERARAKAAERGLDARFVVADVLSLAPLGVGVAELAGPAETVLDSGVFHTFSDEDRPRYVASLSIAVRSGGMLYLMCFSDRQPGGFGPRRVSQDELRLAFGSGWIIEAISADMFDINPVGRITQAHAWLASIRRG